MTRPGRRSLAIVALLTLAALGSSAPATGVRNNYPQVSGRLNSAVDSCGGAAAGGDFGTVWLTRLPGNYVSVKVQIRKGWPNTTYVVNITCGGVIGTVRTGGDGRVTALLQPTAAYDVQIKTQLAIDVHVDDASFSDKAQTPLLTLPLL